MNTKIAPIQSVIAKPHLGRWPRLSTSCAWRLIGSHSRNTPKRPAMIAGNAAHIMCRTPSFTHPQLHLR